MQQSNAEPGYALHYRMQNYEADATLLAEDVLSLLGDIRRLGDHLHLPSEWCNIQAYLGRDLTLGQPGREKGTMYEKP